jgi:uncharacterized membrane protein HdeD (DUF308 family)
MVEILRKNWWLLVLRGDAAIGFGILTFIWPGPTLAALVMLFGAYAMVEGTFAIASGVLRGSLSGSSRWLLVLEGLVGVIIGVITFFASGITAVGLLYYIGAWAIVTGIFKVVAAIQLRQVINNEWLLIFGGILSLLFGVLVFIYPGASALSILWLIGIYAVVFGATTVALGFRLKGLGTTLSGASMAKV